jgi:tetratricopeptide (TPR) repeat protein
MRHAIRNLALRNLLIALAMLVTASAALVRTYTWARRYEDARSQFERTDEVAPNFPVLHEEQAEQAIAGRDLQLKAVAERGGQGYWQMQLKLSQQQPKPPEGYVTPFGLAVIYAQLGNKDLALISLEQAFEQRDVQLTEMNVEPAFDVLRADPRIQTLLRRIHLA